MLGVDFGRALDLKSTREGWLGWTRTRHAMAVAVLCVGFGSM
jgi:hypothetical protein